MKSSEKLNAPSAEHRKLGENRFEHWLRQLFRILRSPLASS
jgi:hypothetical protein